ncbi:MAG TPA: hypothetical protein VG326_20210, partial [Tepidisphaeraceae bacterium]|nr:hypothetical protein [Tepidisphaeraceae bacterium]
MALTVVSVFSEFRSAAASPALIEKMYLAVLEAALPLTDSVSLRSEEPWPLIVTPEVIGAL